MICLQKLVASILPVSSLYGFLGLHILRKQAAMYHPYGKGLKAASNSQ